MSKPPEVLALIPARGGSRSVPRKNIMMINGQPLISHSIAQALESARTTRVIVSTDDLEISTIAKEWGAETPFLRPSEFAADLSPDIDVFRHALTWLKHNEGYEPAIVVHLRATGPVRKVSLIDRAIETIVDAPEADSLRSVSLADHTPYKMWLLEGEFMRPVVTHATIRDAHSVARQMLPKAYWQNGYVDIVRPRTILEKGSMVGENVLGFPIDEPIYEIDYPEDVARVEEALRRLRLGLPLDAKRRAQDRHPV